MSWETILRAKRQVGACMVMRDNKVLLLRRSDEEDTMQGLWEFPGGKVEGNETPKSTAKIETEEEAGLNVKLVKYLGANKTVDSKGINKEYHVYLGEVDEDAKVTISTSPSGVKEHDKYAWFTIDEALEQDPLSRDAKVMLEKMKGFLDSHDE